MQGTIDVRTALDDFVEYLCDHAVPLTVVDSIETLLDSPPELTAEMIATWASAQREAGSTARVSDYLHHAMRKIAMMSEFNLIDMERLRPFLIQLSDRLMAHCPPGEQALFVSGLRSIGRANAPARSAVSVLYRSAESVASDRHAGPDGAPVGPATGVPVAGAPTGSGPVVIPVAARATGHPAGAAAGADGSTALGGVGEGALASSLERFAMLLERLTLQQGLQPPGPPGAYSGLQAAAGSAPGATAAAGSSTTGGAAAAPGAAGVASQALLAEALKSAALGARNPGELDEALRHLAGLGVDASIEQVVRAIARSLPQWLIETDDADDRWKDNRSMAALHRIVAAAPDPPESTRRFFLVLAESVELFNAGDLGRALAAAHVLGRLLREREISAMSADLMLKRAVAQVSAERLLAMAIDPGKRRHVRRFLSLFPDFSPPMLLARLAAEPDRQKRKVLLATVEAWGSRARPAVVAAAQDIQSGQTPDPNGFVERNLVYALRRTSPHADGWHADEIEVLRRASDPTRPAMVVREAVRALGKIPGDAPPRILVQRLGQLERALVEEPGSLPFTTDQGIALLDRIAEALEMQGQPMALRAIEAHSRRKEPELGACLSRIELLHKHDLARSAPLAQRIIERIEADLPSRLAAFALRSRGERLTPLVVALSGTRTPEVVALMEQLAEKFSREPYGAAAQAFLDQRPVPPAAPQAPRPDEDDLTGQLAPTGPVDPDPGEIAAAAIVAAASAESAGASALAPHAISAPAHGAVAGTSPAGTVDPRPRPAAPAARAISGALDIFGLPSLLQNFAMSKLSGSLVLTDDGGRSYAEIALERGGLAHCKVGHLEGESALHQVFETAQGGGFSFTSTADPGAPSDRVGPDITGLIFESLRRVDELQLLRALVPDGARLTGTGVKPTVVPDESDTALQRQAFILASSGRPIEEIEAELPVDTYRVRKMLAHWLEKKALAIAS